MSKLRAGTLTVGQGSAKVIPGSTIFDEDSTSELNRTPGTAGNTRVFTFSCWIKKTDPTGNTSPIFNGGVDANDYFKITIASDDKLYVSETNGGSYREFFCSTNVLFRDPTGWMHVHLRADSTSSTADHRIRVYINGVELPGTRTYSIAQDYSYYINTTNLHAIGRASYNAGEWFNGCISEVNHIDGAALAPSDFAYTDPLTGTWRPKKFSAFNNPNNVTTWSSGWATPSGGWHGSGGAANSFDGSSSTYTSAVSTGVEFTWTNPGTLSGNLRVYADATNSGIGAAIKVNGSQVTTCIATQWYDLGTFDSISSIAFAPAVGNRAWVYIIEVDGFAVLDGASDNSFHLPLDGTGYSAFQTIGNMVEDQSGNQNNFTSSGTLKFITDTPSGASGQIILSGITTTGYPSNYATISSLWANSAQASTYEDRCVVKGGGTKAFFDVGAGGSRFKCNTLDIVLNHNQGGKYYFEMSSAGGNYCQIGMDREDDMVKIGRSGWGISGGGKGYAYQSGGSWGNNISTLQSGQDTWSTYGQIAGLVIDMDNYKLIGYCDGVKQAYEPDFSSKIDSLYPYWIPMISLGDWGSDLTGDETATVWMGQEPFNYLPDIDGLKPLCAANQSQGTIVKPDEYLKVVTYTGENSANTSGTGNTWGIPVDLGFTPDLVMLKSRTQTYGWYTFDSVRRGDEGSGSAVPGAELECYNYLEQQGTGAQGNGYGNGIGLRKNGFNVDIDGQSVGEAGQGADNMFAFCFKGGGFKDTFNIDDVGYSTASACGLDGGSTSPTGASVNTKHGFSIIKYQGDGNNTTISHGLKKAPGLIIQKFVSSGGNWNIWSNGVHQTRRMTFTDAAWDSGHWNDTYPTDSVFSIGSGINDNGVDMIAYLWQDIPGLQKFGTYYGNNKSFDGPYIQLGFKPALIVLKGYDFASNWNILDCTRDPYNVVSKVIRFNLGDAEFSSTSGQYAIMGDALANGFKIKCGDGGAANDINDGGQQFIYWAWAKSPSGNLYGAQPTAK